MIDQESIIVESCGLQEERGYNPHISSSTNGFSYELLSFTLKNPPPLGSSRIALDDFKHFRLLRTGKFSNIWKVQEKRTKEEMCLKQIAVTQGYKFLTEMLCLANVHGQPNFIQCQKCFVDRDIFFVMELCKGSLEETVTPFTTDVMYTFVQQLTGAMCFLHERRIAHTDIYPRNVLMNNKNEFVLTDFGCAVYYAQSSNEHKSKYEDDDYAFDWFSIGIMLVWVQLPIQKRDLAYEHDESDMPSAFHGLKEEAGCLTTWGLLERIIIALINPNPTERPPPSTWASFCATPLDIHAPCVDFLAVKTTESMKSFKFITGEVVVHDECTADCLSVCYFDFTDN